MTVTEPVSADIAIDPGLLRYLLNNPVRLNGIDRPAALATQEDLLAIRRAIAKVLQRFPGAGR